MSTQVTIIIIVAIIAICYLVTLVSNHLSDKRKLNLEQFIRSERESILINIEDVKRYAMSAENYMEDILEILNKNKEDKQ